MDDFETRLQRLNCEQLREYITGGRTIDRIATALGIGSLLVSMFYPGVFMLFVVSIVVVISAYVSVEVNRLIDIVEKLLAKCQDK